jgi:hypothetical protein
MVKKIGPSDLSIGRKRENKNIFLLLFVSFCFEFFTLNESEHKGLIYSHCFASILKADI